MTSPFSFSTFHIDEHMSYPNFASTTASRPGKISWNACLATTRAGGSYVREMAKLAFRSVFHLQESRAWLDYWNSSPYLSQLATLQPRLIKKIYRPYLFRQLDCKQRASALKSHYNFIVQRELDSLVWRAAQMPVLLSTLAGRSGQSYRLELVAIEHMEREGELVLQLTSDGVVIYSVAFTFVATGAARQLAVGCLQGGRADDALARIRAATRDLAGLRPKTLLIRVLQQLGSSCQCTGLNLVGNANRVMLQQMRKGRVIADYDSSWCELGGQRQADGNFALDCGFPVPPDLSAIASNKRSEARRRHALVTSAADDACAVFLAPRGMQAFHGDAILLK